MHIDVSRFGDVRGTVQAKYTRIPPTFVFHPFRAPGSGAVRNFEAHRFLSFALQSRSSFLDLARGHDIDDFHLHQVTAAKLTFDRYVLQSEVALVLREFKPNPNRPDVFGLEWPFLTNNPALIRRGLKCADGG